MKIRTIRYTLLAKMKHRNLILQNSAIFPEARLSAVGVAVCLVDLNGLAPSEFRIIPSGKFKARDGRPKGLDGWVLTPERAKKIVVEASQQEDRFVIDYEHQTLYSRENGKPAPAAGWFKALEWRDDGLYATVVEWTEAALASIQAKEYRYISPVLSYDKKTGAVTGILMAALVNFPAIDGLTDLAAAHFFINQPREESMNPELLELLGLPDDAEESVVMSSAFAKLEWASGQIEALTAEINTLKTQSPDPAKYAPFDTVKILQAQIAELSAQVRNDEISKLVEPALSDGRLLPSLKGWAMDLGAKDVEALGTFLKAAQPIAALGGTQTGGRDPTDGMAALTNQDVSVRARAYKHRIDATGTNISYGQAVDAVLANKDGAGK